MGAERSVPPRVLVVRNDRLGDFLLAWPALGMLKASLPAVRLAALVPEYTADLARHCPWVDAVITDPGRGSGVRSALALSRRLRAERFDAVIALFSTGRIAAVCALAGIPWRLGPATKVAQLLLTHRVLQRRSRSLKPEFEYNTDLVRAFLGRLRVEPRPVAPPFLQFPDAEVLEARAALCRSLGIDPAWRLVFLHPGGGGSAPMMPVRSFVGFARALRSDRGHALVVTAGPGEAGVARTLAAGLRDAGVRAFVHESVEGLVTFARRIAAADLFVGGSTGPLHLAGALDRPTVGFYPRTRAGSALRWQTLNSAGRGLAFDPPPGTAPEALEAIDLEQAAARASAFLGA